MELDAIVSGLGGAGGAGAVFMYLLRRMIATLDKLKDSLDEIKLKISGLETDRAELRGLLSRVAVLENIVKRLEGAECRPQ